MKTLGELIVLVCFFVLLTGNFTFAATPLSDERVKEVSLCGIN